MLQKLLRPPAARLALHPGKQITAIVHLFYPSLSPLHDAVLQPSVHGQFYMRAAVSGKHPVPLTIVGAWRMHASSACRAQIAMPQVFQPSGVLLPDTVAAAWGPSTMCCCRAAQAGAAARTWAC